MSELPAACQQYQSVVETVKAKEPEIDPFAGMAGGTAVSAKAARAGGRGTLDSYHHDRTIHDSRPCCGTTF